MSDETMSEDQTRAMQAVMVEVMVERQRQHAKWGEQNHPAGTGGSEARDAADVIRTQCQTAFAAGEGTWRHILREEVYEAFAESDLLMLRTELIQVAAVAVAWIEDINRNLAEAAEAKLAIAVEALKAFPEPPSNGHYERWDWHAKPLSEWMHGVLRPALAAIEAVKTGGAT